MIRPLRRAHRAVFAVLALALPAIVALAVASRAPDASGPVPSALASPSCGRDVRARVGPWVGVVLDTRVCDASDAPGALVLVVRPRTPVPQPDLLLYWVHQLNAADTAVPPGARLIGTLDGTDGAHLLLPPGATTGELVLVSGAYQTRLGSAPVVLEVGARP